MELAPDVIEVAGLSGRKWPRKLGLLSRGMGRFSRCANAESSLVLVDDAWGMEGRTSSNSMFSAWTISLSCSILSGLLTVSSCRES